MVTVVGLGFVGLTCALGFAEYGHKVYGIEIDPHRLDTIKSGKLPFVEPGLDDALVRHLENGRFIPTDSWETAIAESDVVYYCVGTPYGEDGQADLTYLFGAIDQTLDAIDDDRFRALVVKSTIPPSTCETRIIPFLEDRGVRVGETLGLANNPEFLREGHCWEDFIETDRVVLGVSDERTEEMLRGLYKPCTAPVISVSLNTGEFIKYLSNTSLACLISFANEMSIAADVIGGIDVAKAFRILHLDKRWQTGTIRAYMYPGCGYGGYCLPKDTNAFHALTKGLGFDGPILEDVIATNDAMPEVTCERILRKVEGVENPRIAILGLAFNPGSSDVRDTPSAKIIRCLNERGCHNIVAFDPLPLAQQEFIANYDVDCEYARSYEAALEGADVAAITTAWDTFGDLPERFSGPIVDCRYML